MFDICYSYIVVANLHLYH